MAVDFDSQANLTTCYGIEKTNELEHTIGHLMMAQLEDKLPKNLKSYIKTKQGVDFIPSSIYLSVVDAKLRLEMGAERIQSEVLERVRDHYGYVVIDTCPSLGMLTMRSVETAGMTADPGTDPRGGANLYSLSFHRMAGGSCV